MTTPFPAVVTGVARISPNFVRVTVGELDERHFEFVGHDQWFRLILPLPGQERPVFPQPAPGQRLWEAYYAMPDDERPVVRNYTVRAARPELREIDVDFVVHGDEGPASRWAQTVRPGDRLGIIDQGAMFVPRDDADWFLLVADETGLPAVAGVLDSIGQDRVVTAFVEVPVDADRQPVTVPARGGVEWFTRDGRSVVESEQLQKAVASADFPDGDPQILVVGESSMVRAVRRHLVNERGIAKDRITFCGFWRHHSTPDPTGEDEE
ncbi:NADPH-dependent ferric siderophore reductase [Stackebrandtia albiflava]|uniref:NADPH-dependent ferric siderophore reductase n=1 Tax=Stackebrandtia albiflava TaxID=406432 RepID=A0A562VEF5_9ACTN|nr:siderophore-interacting protein [Stackebrandtia albiflava]TWJ16245.1 NADPH-dependent ferric siderophore reductase [Stackebrandtia albiflava]